LYHFLARESHRRGRNMGQQFKEIDLIVRVSIPDETLKAALSALSTTMDQHGGFSSDRAVIPFRQYLVNNLDVLDELLGRVVLKVDTERWESLADGKKRRDGGEQAPECKYCSDRHWPDEHFRWPR